MSIPLFLILNNMFQIETKCVNVAEEIFITLPSVLSIDFYLCTFAYFYLLVCSDSENPSATDICDGAEPNTVTNKSNQPPTADDYKQAFINISEGIVKSQDCLILISLLRSSDTQKLTDGLQLVLKLSITTTENKVGR